MTQKTILVVGTYDTKDDELNYIAECIRNLGGKVLTMDVSVLGDPSSPTDYSKHDVAKEGESSVKIAIESRSENIAMQIMAKGAAALTSRLYKEEKFDGVVVLGGSMATDLALDVCSAVPLGVPKYIVSTVSFSALLPPERLAADTQMILWAGGLYGLNAVCRLSLSQAAGAVLGAAQAVERDPDPKPLIGMTSLGKSALRYMVPLKPALEERGFEVAVFHATGMGGRAFESLAAQGAFACVFDFCTQELGNHIHGSSLTAGADRLTNAGNAGIPQIVAPGCHDLVDVIGWKKLDKKWKKNDKHTHNRLITSIVLNAKQRRKVARAHAKQLAKAKSETVFLLPKLGCGEWDRPTGDLHNPKDMKAFFDELRDTMPANVDLREVDAHINDKEFADAALEVFDDWLKRGIVRKS